MSRNVNLFVETLGVDLRFSTVHPTRFIGSVSDVAGEPLRVCLFFYIFEDTCCMAILFTIYRALWWGLFLLWGKSAYLGVLPRWLGVTPWWILLLPVTSVQRHARPLILFKRR